MGWGAGKPSLPGEQGASEPLRTLQVLEVRSRPLAPESTQVPPRASLRLWLAFQEVLWACLCRPLQSVPLVLSLCTCRGWPSAGAPTSCTAHPMTAP